PCRFAQLRAIDDACTRRLVTEKDVLGHRQLRYEAELLVHRRDAQHLRIAWRADDHRLAVEDDLAGIPAIRAAEDLHQRRFAGAVLAEQDVHLAGAKVEVHAVERDHAGEGFRDGAHLEDGATALEGHRTAAVTKLPLKPPSKTESRRSERIFVTRRTRRT